MMKKVFIIFSLLLTACSSERTIIEQEKTTINLIIDIQKLSLTFYVK